MKFFKRDAHPARPPSRWRWLRRAALLCAGLALLMRAVLPLLLPGMLQRVASKAGLDLRYEKLDFSILTGSLELWNLELRRRAASEAGEAVLLSRLEYLLADVDMSSLLMGKLMAHRAEIDGLDVHLERESLEAGWSLHGLLPAGAASAAPAESEDDEPKAAEPGVFDGYDLRLPVGLRALRLQHLQLHVHDAAREPAFDTRLELNVRLSDLGSEGRPTRLEVYSHAAGCLDGFELEGSLASSARELTAQLDLNLRGLRLRALEPYLLPLGLRPNAERHDFRLQCALEVHALDEPGQVLGVKARMTGIELRADGRESLAVDSFELGVSHWSPSEVRIENSTLRGVRARLERLATGNVALAGMELLPVAALDQDREPEPVPAAGKADGAQPALGLPSLHIAALCLEDVQYAWEDQALTPPVHLQGKLDELCLNNIHYDPEAAPQSVQLSASMQAQGIFGALSVTGQLEPFGPEKRCELELRVADIKPLVLNPYLAAMGLASGFESGSLGGRLKASLGLQVDGSMAADLQLSDLRLDDGSPLFAIRELGIMGLRLDPASGATSIDEVLWSGTRLHLSRDVEGRLHGLGLVSAAQAAGLPRPAPAASSAAAAVPAQPSSAQAELVQLPSLNIQRIAWTDTQLEFIDASLGEPQSLVLDQMGFEMRGLALGGPPGSVAPAAADFKLWFEAQGLADQLECIGTLQSKPGPLDLALELSVAGSGLSYQALQPWLREFGLESQLAAGELSLGIEASLLSTVSGLGGGFALRDVSFDQAGESLLALDSLEVPSFQLGASEVRIEALRIGAPRMALKRNAAGTLSALGLGLLGLEKAPKANATEASPIQTRHEQPEALQVQAASAPAKRFFLGHLALEAARIEWQDSFLEPRVESALNLQATLGAFNFGSGAPASPFEFLMSIDGALEELRFAGQLTPDPDQLALSSVLSMRGLRAGVIDAYLPDGMQLLLRDGRLSADLEAAFGQRKDAGGQAAKLQLSQLDFRDGEAPRALLSLQQALLDAPLLDMQQARFEIAELSMSGLELETSRGAQGELKLLGLAISASEQRNVAAVAPAEPPSAQAAPLALSEAAGSAAVPAATSALVPTLLLGKLDVGIARLSFLDESQPGAEPLNAALRLFTARPQILLAPDAEQLPPIEFLVQASATPILAELETRINLTPFQPEPGLEISSRLAGLRGAGLTEVLPQLAELLDGSALADGVLECDLRASLQARRKSPLDFDLGSGFGLELELLKFALRDRPAGEELLALESAEVIVKSIRPASGEVHVERVELVRPKLHASKSSEGIQLLGFLLKAQPESESTAEPDPEASTGAAARALPPRVLPEMRLDTFLISGADFAFVDRSVEPIMEMPIADFDFELKRFSTETLFAERPFQFSATLYGGEIQLKERNAAGNLLGGMLGSLASLVSQDDELDLEARPVFDELVLRGNLSLGPKPKGWAQLRLRALELPAFRGNAIEAGVEIGDGLLNESAMLHFDGLGGLRVSSHTNISYLSLSEPPGGPISSYLKLPAPVDTVLFVLRDEEGDQNIPLHLKLDEQGISISSILGAVSQTLGLIIGDAIASSPMKIIGGVLDLAGLEAQPIELEGDEVVRLEFATGDVQPPATLQAQLTPLLELLRADSSLYLVVEHQLSALDLACCEVLANPPAAECLLLAQNLRNQRTLWLAEREACVAELRAAEVRLDLQGSEAARARLRALELDLGSTEAALDRVLELTRPGAERGRARRARGTALEVAARRLSTVVEQLRTAPIEGISTRIDARRPRFGVTEGLELGAIQISVQRRQ